MDGGVGGIGELAGDEAARNLPGQLSGPVDSALHPPGAVSQHQLRAVGAHQLPPLRAHGLRHDDDHPVSPGSGHGGGQADARIAGGGLDDDGAGPQQAPPLRIVHHGPGNPVLHAAGGVEALQLGQNPGLQALLPLEVCQLQKGRTADQLLHRRIDAAHKLLLPLYPKHCFRAEKPEVNMCQVLRLPPFMAVSKTA